MLTISKTAIITMLRFFLLFFILVVTSTNLLFGQYNIFEVNGKYGIKNSNTILFKPKYDLIIIGDTCIFNLNKGDKWEYKNKSGKSIYKYKGAKGYPFRNGFGMIYNKKSYSWQSIDENGKVLGFFLSNSNPIVLGRYIVNEYSKKLYKHTGQFYFEYDSVKTISSNIILFYSTETAISTKKVFGVNIKQNKEINRQRLLSTNIDTVFDNIISYNNINNYAYYFTTQKPKNNFLFSTKGNLLLSNIEDCKIVSNNKCIIKTNKNFGLYDIEKKTWDINPRGLTTIDSVSGYLWFGSSDSLFSYVSDGKNSLVKVESIFEKKLNYNYILASNSNSFALYTASGKKMSDNYKNIIDVIGPDLIIIEDNNKFAYLNLKTKKIIGDYYDLYYTRHTYGGNSKGRGLATAIIAIFAMPLLPLINKYNGQNSITHKIYLANKPSPFYNGCALIGKAKKNSAKNVNDSLFVDGAKYNLDYFFIDTLGKPSPVIYEEALPFYENWTWVKNNKGYFRINKKFEQIDKVFYTSVEEAWNFEYYIVEKEPWKIGIMNKKGEWIVPAIYKTISVRENQISALKDGEEIILLNR